MKVKFRQASNYCKTILEASKLAYAIKKSINLRNLALTTWQIANSVLNKDKSTILPLFSCITVKVLSSTFEKCLLKSLLRTLTMMTQVAVHFLSSLELI